MPPTSRRHVRLVDARLLHAAALKLNCSIFWWITLVLAYTRKHTPAHTGTQTGGIKNGARDSNHAQLLLSENVQWLTCLDETSWEYREAVLLVLIYE